MDYSMHHIGTLVFLIYLFIQDYETCFLKEVKTTVVVTVLWRWVKSVGYTTLLMNRPNKTGTSGFFMI